MNLDEVLARFSGLPDDAKAELTTVAASLPNKFIPSPGPQTEAWFCKADVLLYGGEAGGGKQLDDETLVPVPVTTDRSGYKRHGDLMPGDRVYSPSGAEIGVLAVSEVTRDADAMEVVFSTGERIVADAGHLWHTWTKRDRDRALKSSDEWRFKRRAARPSRAVPESKKPWVSAAIAEINRCRVYEIERPSGGVRKTRQIAATVLCPRGRPNHSIDATGPLDGQDCDLPSDPYLLGLWLGDGASRGPRIGMDAEDWAALAEHVPAPSAVYVDDGPSRARPFVDKAFLELKPALDQCGLRRNKHIPAIYLRGSHRQRLELFRGLMDTDGTCGATGQMELGFSDRGLAEAAHELAGSLGIKATLRRKRTARKDHYRFKFVAPFACFRLARKVARQWAAACPAVTRRRFIVGVNPVASRPMRCIQVNAPDGLYLVTRSFIATHNSGLLCGLALEQHRQSLLMRRNGVDLAGGGGLIEDLLRIYGSRDGFSGQAPPTLRADGRIITFGSATNIGDEQKYQGRARDLLGIDEAAQFAETQVRFMMGWVRTTHEGQRTRTVLATNPPMSAEGEWIVRMFRPWLDPTHHNPAKPGELRWFVTTADGDIEVDGPEPREFGIDVLIPTSRTFIPARLSDNPFIIRDQYQKQLDALPEPYRSAARDGNFMAVRQDDQWQAIPSAWVREAQMRWRVEPPDHAPMSALAVDVAQGGADQTVLSVRCDAWFAPLEVHPGSTTPTGNEVAGLVVARRRNGCAVIVDMGGGYGGATKMRLEDNGIEVVGHKGAEASVRRTADQALKFANKRSEVVWRFREALDPGQDGGSHIALPDDPELVADLTAPRYTIGSTGIRVESKDDIIKRLGRSPDKGDAVVMCWSAGPRLMTHGNIWRDAVKRTVSGGPNVVLGRANARRRR